MKKLLKIIAGIILGLIIPFSTFALVAEPLNQGGTGWATSTIGDILIGTSSISAYTRLPISTTGKVLSVSGGTPTWVATSSLGISSSPGGSTQQFQYNNAGVFAGSATLRNASGRILVDKLGTLSDDTLSTLQVAYSTSSVSPDYVFPSPSSSASQSSPGAFTATGNFFSFAIYAYKNFGSNRVYSNNSLQVDFTDNGLGGTFNIALTWSAPNSGGSVDGYRVVILEDDVNSYYGNYAFDTTGTSYTYNGTTGVTTDYTTSPTLLTGLGARINGRLLVDPSGMADDGVTAFQLGGDGNMNLFPSNWGGGVQQHFRFGDQYHQIVNVYGDGFMFSTYPGSNDPMYFGSNFDAAFSYPRANAMIILPSNTNPTTFQTLIGANITTADFDGSTPFQVVSASTTAIADIHTTYSNDDPTELTYQSKVLTTSNASSTIKTFTIPSSTTYMLEAKVTARRTGGSSGTANDSAGYIIQATYKNVGGTATLVGAINRSYTAEDQGGWDAIFAPTGATVQLNVSGLVNNNISWVETTKVYPIGS